MNPDGDRHPVADHPIVITNVVLTPYPQAGGHDELNAKVVQYRRALEDDSRDVDGDAGYESAGHGIKPRVKQPTDGSRLAPDNRAYNRLLRGLRWQGERGFAILTGRWRTLRRTTVSPAGPTTLSSPR